MQGSARAFRPAAAAGNSVGVVLWQRTNTLPELHLGLSVSISMAISWLEKEGVTRTSDKLG